MIRAARGGIGGERGVALIIALLMTALLTITVMEFFFTTEVDTRMSRNSLHALQASLMARSGIALGEAYLMKDEDQLADSFSEEWCPQPAREGQSCRLDETNSQILIPENMRLRVEIFDESGKLNINATRPRNQNEWRVALTTQNPQAAPQLFQSWNAAMGRLMESRGINPEVAEAVQAYWDAAFERVYGPVSQPGQAGTPTVAPTPVAQATAGPTPQIIDMFDFLALDDLTRIAGGLSAGDLRRLRSAMTVLGRNQQRVNANTASRSVLTAILGDAGAVDSIIQARQNAPLKQQDLQQYTGALGQEDPSYRNARVMVGVNSYYYRIRASAIVNVDPVSGRGGVSRSAEMLVQRIAKPVQAGGQAGGQGGTLQWSLTRMNWHKEGGAALFRPEVEAATDGSSEDYE